MRGSGGESTEMPIGCLKDWYFYGKYFICCLNRVYIVREKLYLLIFDLKESLH